MPFVPVVADSPPVGFCGLGPWVLKVVPFGNKEFGPMKKTNNTKIIATPNNARYFRFISLVY